VQRFPVRAPESDPLELLVTEADVACGLVVGSIHRTAFLHDEAVTRGGRFPDECASIRVAGPFDRDRSS